jgi:hypothetical protein
MILSTPTHEATACSKSADSLEYLTMRGESTVNNTIEAQALPLVINGISELNMKKTIVHAAQEK